MIKRLKVCDVRNLEEVDIEPSAGLNVVFGPNGSGKTSLLEAINVLSRARSFRAGKIENVIRHGKRQLTVFGLVEGGSSGAVGIGVERSVQGVRARIGGREAQGVAELAERMPVVIISPDSQRLLEEGPDQRREFLNWGVFHVEPQFLPVWVRYARALKQRNAALRENAGDTGKRVWDSELIALAERIDSWRREYLAQLLKILPRFLGLVTGLEGLDISYSRGWPEEEALSDALKRTFDRDTVLGYTQLGPHRADLILRMEGVAAREVLSRGLEKVVVVALRLAQVAVLRELTGKRSIVIIDDLAAELDKAYRARLLELVANLDVQVFITAVDPGVVDASWWQPQKMFHVEHGRVTEMVY